MKKLQLGARKTEPVNGQTGGQWHREVSVCVIRGRNRGARSGSPPRGFPILPGRQHGWGLQWWRDRDRVTQRGDQTRPRKAGTDRHHQTGQLLLQHLCQSGSPHNNFCPSLPFSQKYKSSQFDSVKFPSSIKSI